VCLLIAFAGAQSVSARPWSEHVNHLALLSHTIETDETEIRSLIKQKRHTEDAEQIAQIMKQIGEHHKSLQKATREYEEERQHVRFEHPEKNEQLERSYVRHDLKSVDDFENEMGLDGRLDVVRTKVLKTFPLPPTKSLAAQQKGDVRKPASESAEDDTPEKIHLVK
jgi:hypothetical protein